MKKRKLIFVVSALILLVALSAVMALPAFAVTDDSFIAEPSKTLTLGVDYEYSFALVGDTQSLNVADCKNGTKNMNVLYNWIKDNKESKNIQYVLGLGDITDTFKSSGDYYSAEWENAKEAISILDEAGIPYSLVRGNHDVPSGFNATFGVGSTYYNDLLAMTKKTDENGRPMAGFCDYLAGSSTDYRIENTYRKITVGEDKYIILTLDWAPSEAAVAWTNNVLSENSDYTAVITLHHFLSRDGCITDDIDATLPHENIGDANWGESVYEDGIVIPRDLWENALSKHANVKTIFSGHVETENIITSQLRGDNGNTVTAMLVNPQGIDAEFAPVGMVAMFYVAKGGEVAHVEYISTVRATDGNDDTNAYLGDVNQFSVTLDHKGNYVSTPYGDVPTSEYGKYTFHIFSDDDGDLETDNIYLGGSNTWVSSDAQSGTVIDVKTHFNWGGTAAKRPKNVYVVMTENYDGTSDGNYANIGDIAGGFILDLNGFEFKTGNKPIFCAYSRQSDREPRFEIRNGDLCISGTNTAIALQTTQGGNGGTLHVTFDGVKFYYDKDGTGTTSTPVLTTFGGAAGYNANVKLNVNNCDFDLMTNAPSGKTITLFNLNDANNNNHVALNIKGCSVTAASSANPVIYTLAAGDATPTFSVGNDGYMTLSMPHGVKASGDTFTGSAGEELVFTLRGEGSDLDVYTLGIKKALPEGSKGEIDIWLIGGQSNAAGYGTGSIEAALSDARYESGFENVLYYGSADDNIYTSFVPVKIGLGNKAGRVGAEIGIASVLGNSDRMNAVIKLGRGSSYLYPDTSNSASKTYGTWTSPSYIENNNVNTSGTKTGYLYSDFIETVTDAIEILISEGYTPVIRGMWWMQGEAETYNETGAGEYVELLECLVSDLRRDIGDILGADCSNMPFVMGKITRNTGTDADGNAYATPPYIDKVVEAQYAALSVIANTYIVDTASLNQTDAWHFDAESQKTLGESFVETVIAAEGKYGVIFDGKYFTSTGAGAYSEGADVTVSVTADEGCVINKVYYIEDGKDAVEITLSSDGTYSFVMPKSGVCIRVDAEDVGSVKTDYGTIPSRYASADSYPFAVFKDGEFFSAYAKWNDLLQAGYSILPLSSSNDESATVLLRRDYSTSEDSSSSQNLYLFEGDITIDLDKHTLTRGSKHLFQVMAKKQSETVRDRNIKIINGTILASGSTPFVINTNTNASTLADHFGFEFDGVTFGLASGSSVVNLVFVTYTGGTVETSVDAIFDNCVFDLVTVAPASTVTLFNLKESSGSAKTAKIWVSNSVIKANSASDFVIYAAASTDKVFYESGITLELPTGAEAPVSSYSDTQKVEYAFTKESEADGKTIYALGLTDSKAETTSYGVIPGDYVDSQTYPFVFFRDGAFVDAYKKWNDFLSDGWSLYPNTEGNTGTLLLRRDYSTGEDSSSSQNLYTVRGELTIDLDNHTLTRGSKHLFQVMAKYSSVSDKSVSTDITVKNGTILAEGNAPLAINTNTGAGFDDIFNFTFNGVTFGLASGSTVANLVFVTFTNGTYDTVVTAEFNACVFDIRGATKATTLFNLKESSGSAKTATVTVNGCVIKADDSSYLNMYSLATGDSVIFAKDENGDYLKLTLPVGMTAPQDSYPIYGSDEKYVFGAPVKNNDGITYELSPQGLSDFKIKTNVTLDSDFIYNIYIPVFDNIEAVALDGKRITLVTLEKTLIDNKQYYVLSRNVSANEAATDMTLTIKAVFGNDTYTGNWTLSIVRYAKGALATDQTDVTKKLLSDMLSYIRSAYEYFATTGLVGADELASVRSTIDAIIGADYDSTSLPEMKEDASLSTEGLESATVRLDAEISFKFYPKYDAEKYVFTMNGRVLESESVNGYILVKTYAYGVRDTIEYTVEGTEISGSYNLKAYYDYMSDGEEGTAELIALLERLWTYSESAENYRNEVNSK